jgi:CBS domain-containing protein
MRVEQFMSANVKTCLANDTLNHAAELMWNHNCGFLPVVRDDASRLLVGVITDRDIAMATYTQGKRLTEIPVTIAMARAVKVCHADDDIGTTEALMRLKQVHRLPVVDNRGQVIGVISLNDIAQSVTGTRDREGIGAPGVTETLAAIARPRDKHGFSVERENIE